MNIDPKNLREMSASLQTIENACLDMRDSIASMAEPTVNPQPAPDPESPSTPAPDPVPTSSASGIVFHRDRIRLGGVGHRFESFRTGFFVRTFVEEAGGVRLSVISIAFSDPQSRRDGQQKRPVRFADLKEILTALGKDIYRCAEPLIIPPGQQFTAWGYEDVAPLHGTRTSRSAPLTEVELRLRFWEARAAHAIQVTARPDWLNKALHNALTEAVDSQHRVGPYAVAWDASGYGHGGQGIEPDAMDWRRTPAGFALAFETALATSNRMRFVISDGDGNPAYTDGVDYSTTHKAELPPEFAWDPYDDDLPSYAEDLAAYEPIDGQHFARVYRDAMFLARSIGVSSNRRSLPREHPIQTFLGQTANFVAAACLSRGPSDSHSNYHYWSLHRTLEEVRKKPGPNKFTGRAAVHLWRFAFEYLAAFAARPSDNGPGLAVYRQMEEVFILFEKLFTESANENGVPFGKPAPAIDVATPDWGTDLAAQTRELRLALLLMEEIAAQRANTGTHAVELGEMTRKLHRYLNTDSGKVINLVTHETHGVEHWGFPLATHGHYPGGSAQLVADAKTRSAEAGGSQPLNYDRHNIALIASRHERDALRLKVGER